MNFKHTNANRINSNHQNELMDLGMVAAIQSFLQASCSLAADELLRVGVQRLQVH